jgi:hypothetical protein
LIVPLHSSGLLFQENWLPKNGIGGRVSLLFQKTFQASIFIFTGGFSGQALEFLNKYIQASFLPIFRKHDLETTWLREQGSGFRLSHFKIYPLVFLLGAFSWEGDRIENI